MKSLDKEGKDYIDIDNFIDILIGEYVNHKKNFVKNVIKNFAKV